jgi:MoxR-like ATPase
MLPADVVGTQIYNPAGGFTTRKGPVFANLVLADEINRAPAKVQSALLEAMQERQVTIGDQTYKLPDPFLVLATQNPIEQEGTYTLPEAQVDRFMLKLKVGYPSREEERLILDLMARTSGHPTVEPVIQPETILKARQVINELYVDDKVKDYIVDVVCATRDPEAYKLKLKDLIQMGASPRATIALTLAAKAHAFIRGRGYVTPQDVKSIGMDVLRHRITLTYEAEAEEKTPEDIVQRLFDELSVISLSAHAPAPVRRGRIHSGSLPWQPRGRVPAGPRRLLGLDAIGRRRTQLVRDGLCGALERKSLAATLVHAQG